jgi:hypothetical protein
MAREWVTGGREGGRQQVPRLAGISTMVLMLGHSIPIHLALDPDPYLGPVLTRTRTQAHAHHTTPHHT